MAWTVKEIFDGDYGCEERVNSSDELMVSVYLENELGEQKCERVADVWLRKNNIDVGSEWPDYSNVRIETKDLVLKKAEYKDWEAIYDNLWKHQESAQYMLWKVTESEAEAKDRIERTILFQKYHKYSFFIYEKESGTPIGFAGMKEIEKGVFEDTGVAFGPKFVGRGYGTQVLNALTEEAEKAGAEKFIASCRVKNIASHNLQMKCGFVFSHFEERTDERTGENYTLEFNEKKLN